MLVSNQNGVVGILGAVGVSLGSLNCGGLVLVGGRAVGGTVEVGGSVTVGSWVCVGGSWVYGGGKGSVGI
jgi:hypothetical protein